VATEIAASVSTRGIYANDPAAGHVSAYDVNAPVWAAPAQAAWSAVAEHPFVAGAFVWSGFDYRGEPTPYRWPCINSAFGMLDTCGFAKDNAWYYKAQWVDAPVLHILPHWNWAGREGREIDVWCHTNCDSVELFVNGRSEGRQDVAPSSHAAWKVKYEPGRLEARGYRGGKEVAAAKVETTGPAAAIALASSRPTLAADGQDVSAITAAVVDDQGRLVPTADHEIVFAADAGAAILGVGNGDPASHEPDKADRRRAFNGLCLAILQSSTAAGPITLTARSQGLRPASITLRAVKAPRMAALPVCPPWLLFSARVSDNSSGLFPQNRHGRKPMEFKAGCHGGVVCSRAPQARTKRNVTMETGNSRHEVNRSRSRSHRTSHLRPGPAHGCKQRSRGTNMLGRWLVNRGPVTRPVPASAKLSDTLARDAARAPRFHRKWQAHCRKIMRCANSGSQA
jgi:hypothetical protein